MKVRAGWSADYAKHKFDVELEENDLIILLAENGIPDEFHCRLTTWERVRLLQTQAEMISVWNQAEYYGQTKNQKTIDQLGVLKGQQEVALAAFRKRAGLEEKAA